MSGVEDDLFTSFRLNYYVKVQRDWFHQCVSFLYQQGYTSHNKERLLDFIYKELLLDDLHHIASPCLPNNISDLSNEVLKGKYVLQVDELKNIGDAVEHRLKESEHRMLKLWMTDGHVCVSGIEYQRLHELSINSAPGLKVAICDVRVRRGLLLLTPHNTQVLGGQVSELVELEFKRRKELSNGQLGIVAPDDGVNRIPSKNATNTNNNKNNNNNKTVPDNQPNIQVDDWIDDEIILDDFDIPDSLPPVVQINSATYRLPVNNVNNLPVRTTKQPPHSPSVMKQPYVYLVKALQSQTSIARVKAAITETMHSPPFSFASGVYALDVRIEDGSMSVICTLGNDLIASMIGMSCDQFSKAMSTSQGRSEAQKNAQRMEKLLTTMEGIFTLQLTSSKPKIMSVENPTSMEAYQLLETLCTYVL